MKGGFELPFKFRINLRAAVEITFQQPPIFSVSSRKGSIAAFRCQTGNPG
jgi:hypothetical protein